ncbi:MAG: hypothetical protein Kilf2KO_44380 [Rhodospirillales bacterium]
MVSAISTATMKAPVAAKMSARAFTTKKTTKGPASSTSFKSGGSAGLSDLPVVFMKTPVCCADPGWGRCRRKPISRGLGLSLASGNRIEAGSRGG